jgi:hypothetical protein
MGKVVWPREARWLDYLRWFTCCRGGFPQLLPVHDDELMGCAYELASVYGPFASSEYEHGLASVHGPSASSDFRVRTWSFHQGFASVYASFCFWTAVQFKYGLYIYITQCLTVVARALRRAHHDMHMPGS